MAIETGLMKEKLTGLPKEIWKDWKTEKMKVRSLVKRRRSETGMVMMKEKNLVKRLDFEMVMLMD